MQSVRRLSASRGGVFLSPALSNEVEIQFQLWMCCGTSGVQFQKKISRNSAENRYNFSSESISNRFRTDFEPISNRFANRFANRFGPDFELLGQKNRRTKVPRIFRFFVPNFAPNFAPNFPRFFEEFSCFVSWETETRKNSPKIPAIFQCKIPRQTRKTYSQNSSGEQAK